MQYIENIFLQILYGRNIREPDYFLFHVYIITATICFSTPEYVLPCSLKKEIEKGKRACVDHVPPSKTQIKDTEDEGCIISPGSDRPLRVTEGRQHTYDQIVILLAGGGEIRDMNRAEVEGGTEDGWQ